MAATKAAATIIAFGTPCPAFTQLSSNAATTRSGTTATLTMASTATLATNDYCLIQGHDLAEYNGIFQITVASGTTITYTIKADPGASSGTTVMTVDKVVLGTALDMTTDYGAQVVIGLQNGNSAPGVAPQVWKGIASTGSALVDYRWSQLFAGDTTAKSFNQMTDVIPMESMYVNYAVCRNTTNAVDCYALASHVTAG